jgi:hypothetical protein
LRVAFTEAMRLRRSFKLAMSGNPLRCRFP